MALALHRSPLELKFCYLCFEWRIESSWDAHCQAHLSHITSKRCGVMNYCHTMVRPAFCPFCIGNESLPASIRLVSFARDMTPVQHLQPHMSNCIWPLRCPHPLCHLPIRDKTSFCYHLDDVHSLKIRPVAKVPRRESESENYIRWSSEERVRKRKRQGSRHLLHPIAAQELAENAFGTSSQSPALAEPGDHDQQTIIPCLLSKNPGLDYQPGDERFPELTTGTSGFSVHSESSTPGLDS